MYKQQQQNSCLQLRYFFDIDRLLRTTCTRIVEKINDDQKNFAEIVTHLHNQYLKTSTSPKNIILVFRN